MSASDYPVIRHPLHIDGAITRVYTTTGSFLIDTEDLGVISDLNFGISLRGCVIVTSRNSYRNMKLHRLFMTAPLNKEVDHINHNPLDNRKVNLRLCDHWENGKNLPLKKNNTSGFAGVRWDNSRNRWLTRIKVNYQGKHIGRYKTIEEAISARLFAEDYYFGEFAPNA